jgi:Nucleotidyl transferase AbiEii toxin, Type IV TA system
MMRLQPRFDVLPPPQRALWPKIKCIPQGFVLYGGTAIALRLGHRASVDIDFFPTIRWTIPLARCRLEAFDRREHHRPDVGPKVAELLDRDGMQASPLHQPFSRRRSSSDRIGPRVPRGGSGGGIQPSSSSST